MKVSIAASGGRLLGAAAALVFVAACDRDPSGTAVTALAATSASSDSLGVQGAIDVGFSRAVDATTALDQANFVVTNTCTGLRVPGSLRLSADGRTVTFSPSQAVPFLTPLAIRVQNILDTGGRALGQPLTFTRTTVGPQVGDVSWQLLDAPSADQLTGVTFVDQNVGYTNTVGGTVYRTVNGGRTFEFRYKETNKSDAYSIRALTADTLYLPIAVQLGGLPQFTLQRSVDGGATFSTFFTSSARLTSLTLRRFGTGTSAGHAGLTGGQNLPSPIYRFTVRPQAPAAQQVVVTQATGVPANGIFIGSDLSFDTTKALATFLLLQGAGQPTPGVISFSADGGKSFAPVNTTALGTLPLLSGVAFMTNTSAIVVGDSSTVLRVDFGAGAPTVTRLTGTGADTIPRTERDNATGFLRFYNFVRASFEPNGQVGYIVGYETRRTSTGAPNTVVGIILRTTNGGANWTRQAINGAAANGIAFPQVNDVQSLSADFVALAGDQGLSASRAGAGLPVGTACSFR